MKGGFLTLLFLLVLLVLCGFAFAEFHRLRASPSVNLNPACATCFKSSKVSTLALRSSALPTPFWAFVFPSRDWPSGRRKGLLSGFPSTESLSPLVASRVSETMALPRARVFQKASLQIPFAANPSSISRWAPLAAAAPRGGGELGVCTRVFMRSTAPLSPRFGLAYLGGACRASASARSCLQGFGGGGGVVAAALAQRRPSSPTRVGLREATRRRWLSGASGSRVSSSDGGVEEGSASEALSASGSSGLAASESVSDFALSEDAVGGALDLGRLCGSVVKVYSDYTDPNYALPWQMQRQGSSSGSGFIIDGRLIVTNAHCVAWQNRLLVRKHGSPTKHLAQVVAVGHECDLALLTVDSEDFWKDTEGLRFGRIPALQDGVAVLGYPRGGDNLCITSGVVSRVDVNTYAHSNTALLCVQIDAAINPGNSGGPALREGRVVGVAFQGWDSAQNVGYVVPSCVIEHFLQDLRRNGRYTGFPAAGVMYQPLENECMRSKLGVNSLTADSLPPGVTAGGILVTCSDSIRSSKFLARAKEFVSRPSETEAEEKGGDSSSLEADATAPPRAEPRLVVEALKKELTESDPSGAAPSPAALHAALDSLVGLRPQDVVLAVDGHDVANDGTVHFRGMERVSVSHVIADKFFGETLELLVLRDKKVQKVVVPLEEENALIPKHQWGKRARYLIYGGLVFCPLTLEYLKDEFGSKFHERAPSTLLRPLAEVFASVEGEEPIVLSQILASDLTSGYNYRNCLLSTVDGVKVRNMRHLAQLLGVQTPEQQRRASDADHVEELASLAESPDEFVTFTLEEKVQVVLHKAKAAAMLPAILQQHAIPSQTSEKL